MSNKVRVRFAPSPTGPLHIGGVRTALFNYLFAKKHGGDFILRIEDTDQNRYVPGAEAYIIEALTWCGIPFDEGPGKEGNHGPYRQSHRKDLYHKYAKQLVDNGLAYYAFDTPEALDHHRRTHEKKGKTFIYNWHNREKLDNSLTLAPKEVAQRLAQGHPYVIRFKTPANETLQLQDLIRGTIEIDASTLDDKVLFKADGMPTYHLANIVDDHLMEITHVIRGEEWLPSLALHYQLYRAFGWKAPEFAHLPLIMKPTGKGKLSKRDGEKGGFPVFPLSWHGAQGYREAGYFPEAVVNFLAMLGWNPGTEQEIFSLKELVQEFSLERVNKAGARFDPEKTKWYNHIYLQNKDNAELVPVFRDYLKGKDLPQHTQTDGYLENVIAQVKERANFVADFWELSHFYFQPPTTYNEQAVKKQWKADTAQLLQGLAQVLQATDPYTSSELEKNTKTYITENNLSFGRVMAPLRLIIVGDLKGPHLFDILAMIGKEETLARIATALKKLG